MIIWLDRLSVIDDNEHIRYYMTPAGKEPFVEWVNDLKDSSVQSRIERRLERILLGNYGDCEPVGGGIFELKLHFCPGYRIYFAEQNETIIVLLCGGDKSSQRKDIKKAKIYWQEFKGRKS